MDPPGVVGGTTSDKILNRKVCKVLATNVSQQISVDMDVYFELASCHDKVPVLMNGYIHIAPPGYSLPSVHSQSNCKSAGLYKLDLCSPYQLQRVHIAGTECHGKELQEAERLDPF